MRRTLRLCSTFVTSMGVASQALDASCVELLCSQPGTTRTQDASYVRKAQTNVFATSLKPSEHEHCVAQPRNTIIQETASHRMRRALHHEAQVSDR